MICGAPVGLIEIGTNSIKYLVAERNKGGDTVYLVDRNDITRIGEGLERSGSLGIAAMERSILSIEAFLGEIGRIGVFPVLVVGTMALRKASNGSVFSRLLAERTGLGLRVLSGREEACYSLGAIRRQLPTDSSGWLFDTGGGSTEYMSFDGSGLGCFVSLELGALTMTERFFETDPVSREKVNAALGWVYEVLLRGGISSGGGADDVLVGTGGNLVTMASVACRGEKMGGDSLFCLDIGEIRRQVDLYREVPVAERSMIPGVPQGRAGIILAGACIVLASAAFLGSGSVGVSMAGLRYGLMESLLSHPDGLV